MDLKECLKILAARQNNAVLGAACPCCKITDICPVASPSPDDTRGKILVNNELESTSTIDLVDAVLHVQESRVRAYAEYSSALDRLLEANNIEGYPTLCSSMTAIFADLSESIVRIKEEVGRRSFDALTTAIVSVQQAEKDKLMYVAALHLDKLQVHLPSLQRVSGNCSVQRNYLSNKIQECETVINEQVQEIVAIKLELIDNNLDS
jgi:hypothetical protein